MNRRLSDLAAAVATARIIGDGSTKVSDLKFDSQHVTPGCLFAALRGGYVDGHEFIQSAIERGADALLVDRDGEYPIPSIRVADTRAALSPIASEFFGDPSSQLGVIGITGTDGKTTTSYLVDSILRHSGKITGIVGTVSVKIAEQTVQQ